MDNPLQGKLSQHEGFSFTFLREELTRKRNDFIESLLGDSKRLIEHPASKEHRCVKHNSKRNECDLFLLCFVEGN